MNPHSTAPRSRTLTACHDTVGRVLSATVVVPDGHVRTAGGGPGVSRVLFIDDDPQLLRALVVNMRVSRSRLGCRSFARLGRPGPRMPGSRKAPTVQGPLVVLVPRAWRQERSVPALVTDPPHPSAQMRTDAGRWVLRRPAGDMRRHGDDEPDAVPRRRVPTSCTSR